MREMPRHRTGAALALVVAAAAVWVRFRLYRELPAIVTNDSWDYIRAADDIRRHLDFFSAALRDVRLPGYPTFLALAAPLTHTRSDAIVAVQAGLGLAAAAAAAAIGRLLRSWWIAGAMLAFVGLAPVYLVTEHAIMPESLGVALYVLLVAAGVANARDGSRWWWGVCVGLLLGAAVLTRANVVVLGFVLVFGAAFLRSDRRLRSAIVPALVAGLVIAPWAWRNWVAYGHFALYSSTSSNILLYKDMHAPLDASLPTLAEVSRTLGREGERVDFEWQIALQARFPPIEAERISRRILNEQIAAHPWQHALDVVGTAAGFVGFVGEFGNERQSLRWWFRRIVGDGASVNALVKNRHVPMPTDWTFVPGRRNSHFMRRFAVLGDLFLVPGRAIGFVVFVSALAWYVRRRRPQAEARKHRSVVLMLTAGYVGTLGMHAMMLTDYDRYATSFDFVPVLITALIVDDLVRAPRTSERHRVPALGTVMSARVSVEEPVVAPLG